MGMYWQRIKAGAYKAHSFSEGTYYVTRDDETGLWSANRSIVDDDRNVQVVVDFGHTFKKLAQAQMACEGENNGFKREASEKRKEQERIHREAQIAKFEAERAERLANNTSHVNHNFGFSAELTAEQVQALVKASARYIGEDGMKLTVQVVAGQMRLEFGNGFNDVREIKVNDSEVTTR